MYTNHRSQGATLALRPYFIAPPLRNHRAKSTQLLVYKKYQSVFYCTGIIRRAFFDIKMDKSMDY